MTSGNGDETGTHGTDQFYDRLASLYHLIYPDWEATIARQGRELATLIRSRWGDGARSVLDVSCGIGTQSLGLAAEGFAVTGSDLSGASIARARREAAARGLDIAFSVCDMRALAGHHPGGHDVVLAADNAVPHLLNEADILHALEAMHAQLRPGGGCIVTLRDYERTERGRGVVQLYGVREVDGTRYLLWQVRDFDGNHYDVSLFIVEDDGRAPEATTHVMRSRYFAVAPGTVMELMRQAGFADVERLDDAFFQPVLVGTREP